MALEKKIVKEKLVNKFEFVPVMGSGHERIALFYGGMKIATTGFSRGTGKNLEDDLLKVMAKEIFVMRLGFFKEMINCSKSKTDYINLLIESGHIKPTS